MPLGDQHDEFHMSLNGLKSGSICVCDNIEKVIAVITDEKEVAWWKFKNILTVKNIFD